MRELEVEINRSRRTRSQDPSDSMQQDASTDKTHARNGYDETSGSESRMSLNHLNDCDHAVGTSSRKGERLPAQRDAKASPSRVAMHIQHKDRHVQAGRYMSGEEACVGQPGGSRVSHWHTASRVDQRGVGEAGARQPTTCNHSGNEPPVHPHTHAHGESCRSTDADTTPARSISNSFEYQRYLDTHVYDESCRVTEADTVHATSVNDSYENQPIVIDGQKDGKVMEAGAVPVRCMSDDSLQNDDRQTSQDHVIRRHLDNSYEGGAGAGAHVHDVSSTEGSSVEYYDQYHTDGHVSLSGAQQDGHSSNEHDHGLTNGAAVHRGDYWYANGDKDMDGSRGDVDYYVASDGDGDSVGHEDEDFGAHEGNYDYDNDLSVHGGNYDSRTYASEPASGPANDSVSQ
jgi:hypothetical protein